MNHESIHTLVKKIAQQLAPLYEHADERDQIAWWIVEYCTGKNIGELLSLESLPDDPELEHRIAQLVHQHVHEHMPLQYLLGSVPFIDITLQVEPPVLIPRPETEEWVFNLIQELHTLRHKMLRILDIGTGSGAIAIALAHALPEAEIIAVDCSNHALSLCKKNCALNTTENIKTIESNLFDALHGQTFDLIVSNPPYITEEEYLHLDPSVRNWEDKHALVANRHGLAIIEDIIKQAPAFLKKNDELLAKNIGQLYIEIGYTQGQAVADYMRACGYRSAKILTDLESKDRVVVGRM